MKIKRRWIAPRLDLRVVKDADFNGARLVGDFQQRRKQCANCPRIKRMCVIASKSISLRCRVEAS
jgi:hypothetical protein